MSLALYRKYRPQRFSDLVDQDHIKTTLANEVAADAITHAYIFHGPRGTGKTTSARIFAKAINCLNRAEASGEPCLECAACVAMANRAALDLIEIDAASQTQVEKTRENIINDAQVAPGQLRYKVFIIDEVHMLSTASFNALLKTLEEPPRHVVFILATTEIHKVPETIISRCQVFKFKKVTTDEVVRKLEYILKEENQKIDPKVIERIAVAADGGVRDAESLLGQVLSMGPGANIDLVLPRSSRTEAFELTKLVLSGQMGPALSYVRTVVDDGILPTHLLADCLVAGRQLLLTLAKTPVEEPAACQNVLEAVPSLRPAQVVEWLQLLMDASQAMKVFDLPLLPLELVIVRFCDRAATPRQSAVGPSQPPTPPSPASVPSQRIPSEIPAASVAPAMRLESIPVPDGVATDAQSIPVQADSKNKDLAAAVDLQQVVAQWLMIAERMTAKNVSSAALVKMTVPIEVRGNVLRLATPFRFYQQRCNDPRNRQLVEDCLEEVLQVKLRVECVLDPAAQLLTRPDVGVVTSSVPASAMASAAAMVSADLVPMPTSPNEPAASNDVVDHVLKIIGGEVVTG